MERRDELHRHGCSIAKQTILTTHPSGLQTRVSVELANFDALCVHSECKTSKRPVWESPFLARRGLLGGVSAHATPVLGRRSDAVNEGRLSQQCTPVMRRREIDSPGGSPLPMRRAEGEEEESCDLDNSVISGWLKFRDNKRITNDDYVCEACWELAMTSVNQNLQQDANEGEPAGPSPRGHTNVCLLCGCSLVRRQSDKILKDSPTELQQNMMNIIQRKIEPRNLTPLDRVCHVCWLRTKREVLRSNRVDEMRVPEENLDIIQDNQVPENPEADQSASSMDSIILPDYKRAANTGNHCVITECTNNGTLHGISDQLRAIILNRHKYYLPKLARVCEDHLSRNSWDSLYESENSMNIFNAEQVQHIFSFVNAFNPTVDFENIEDMDETIFQYWVGLSKTEFNVLLEEVPRISEIRGGKLGLLSLLMKMRTGDSDERIATLVQKPRRTLETIMDRVREVLLQDFVPRYLGITHLSREELISHNLIIPNGLYGNENNVIVICDGTYIYINKSSNYMFQKDTYSLHKYRNLLKPFLIVASDGYIVDCFGPYKATTSDADIMTSLFNAETLPLRLYFRENDVFILDRGFRDSIRLLEQCGYRTYMPDSLLEGEHQLTTAQANRSRCITLCRWVVEVVNGYLKRDYKILRQEYFHRSLPHMMQNFQIAAALLNKFGARLRNNEYANEILNIISQRINLENNLANMIENLNMNRRSANFQNITADENNVMTFPVLEYRDLILFALGTYQIRQARSYYGEHTRFHGGYRIEVCSENINSSEYNLRGSEETILIRGRIKSRHISRKQYYVYILIDNNISGRSAIVEYCCNCLVGRRTVGCCAHVMTLVWYLGWARHQSNISAPAEFLDNIVIREDE